MNRAGRYALIATAVLLAAVSGFFVATYLAQNTPGQDVTPLDTTSATSRLLALALPDTKGVAQPLRQWQGKILVVNFWATWCTPCRKEIPGFSRLQERYAAKDVQFVGIAFDSADKVEEFSRQTLPAYPFLIASHALMPIAVGLGNASGGLPFTVIVGRDGRLYQARLGLWQEAALETVLAGLTR